jgi:competence protein ComEA
MHRGEMGARSLVVVPESAKWQVVAWAVAAAIVVFAGARLLWDRRPEPPPVRVERAQGDGAGRTGARGAGADEESGGVYVHVAGAVRRPGLLRVPEGARVAAAIYRAGGASRGADLTAVNLAQPLEDGQQVVVPRRGAGPDAPGTPSSAAAQPSLATATLEQLDELDGIGPALAQRILDYRESHGGFRSLEELREVDGIGEKRFAALKKALRP